MSGARRALLALSVLAAGLSVIVHQSLFLHGSLDNDEVAYLLQARALLDGHLLLTAPSPVEAYQPWFFAIRPGGYASKYLPLVPALYAVGLALTGTIAPVLAALAAAVPPLTYVLARECGLTAPQGVSAAALVALSPAVLVQTGLALSYLPFLVLLLTAWILLLRLGQGAPPGRTAAGAALAGVAAACARPLDAVLLLLVPALWALAQVARRTGAVRGVAGLVLGGLPIMLAILVYNARVTGGPLRPPFGLLEPRDQLGFGGRKLFPEDRLHPFGVVESLRGAGTHFLLEPFSWFAVSLLLVGAAAVAVAHWGRVSRGAQLLVVSAGLLLGGYLCFWGPYNASVLWGGTRVVGPFYALPLLVPLVVVAVPVLHRLATRSPRLLTALVLVTAVPAAAQTAVTWQQARTDASRTATVLAVADSARRTGPLLVDADPPYLGHPVSGVVNTPGQHVWPVLLSSQVLPRQVDAPAGSHLLQIPEDLYRPGGRFSYVVREQVRAASVQLAVDVTRAGGSRDEILVVERDGRAWACLAGSGRRLALRADGSVAGCSGLPVPSDWQREPYRHCPDASCLAVAYFKAQRSGSPRRVSWRQLPLGGERGGAVMARLDGPVVQQHGGGWISLLPARPGSSLP